MKNPLAELPSVDRMLKHPLVQALDGSIARTVVVRAVREVLDEARAEILSRGAARGDSPDADSLARAATGRARELARPRLRRVINATGVVVHTNLGRSRLSERAVGALAEAARHYVTLEYELATGERSSRQDVVRERLMELTGAEAALVVNNNAAAVVAVLNTLAEGREAVISRGELVEIGGSFRLPEVMAKSGARMVEVGTTNRTRIADYERAVTAETGVLLKVHRSNFAVRGFTAEASIEELAVLARARGIPLVHDLGSGALLDFRDLGATHETMPQESIAAGASVVTFSGDKLLGGPQAGIIVGEAALLARIARNPLMRAIRVEKLLLAAMEATLDAYRDGAETAIAEIPTLAMIGAGREALEKRARDLARRLTAALGDAADVAVIPGASEAGGGSLPDEPMPTALAAMRPRSLSAGALADALRRVEPAVIAFIRDEQVLLDLRTVSAEEERELERLVTEAAKSARGA